MAGRIPLWLVGTVTSIPLIDLLSVLLYNLYFGLGSSL